MTTPTSEKRGPGRPRKNPLPEFVEETVEEEVLGSFGDPEDSAEKPNYELLLMGLLASLGLGRTFGARGELLNKIEAEPNEYELHIDCDTFSGNYLLRVERL